MDFLGGVNRILSAASLIKGDDDKIVDFNNLQYTGAVNLAQIAIQSELNDLIADTLIPYEKKEGTINTVADQRTYDVPSDFIRFYGQNPFLMDSSNDRQIYEVKLDSLRHEYPRYKKDTGEPWAWYKEETTTKKIGLVLVPDSVKTYTFDYEADVSVTNETDTLPFHTESEAQSFIDMATRHFMLLRAEQPLDGLQTDPVYARAKSKLTSLMNFTYPSRRYGNSYR